MTSTLSAGHLLISVSMSQGFTLAHSNATVANSVDTELVRVAGFAVQVILMFRHGRHFECFLARAYSKGQEKSSKSDATIPTA